MNPNDKPVDQVLGAQAAGALVNAWIDTFMTEDLLSREAATRAACERLADRSPWLIVEPGQTWCLREEFAPTSDFSPGRVHVLAVRHAGGIHPHEGTAAVRISDAEHDPDHAIGWMDLEDFDILYALDAWPRSSPPTRNSTTTTATAHEESPTEPLIERLQESECGPRDQAIE